MGYKIRVPLSTFQYEKGYINLVEGMTKDELIIQVFLYDSVDAKNWAKEIDSLDIAGLKVSSEYIPEVDSWCVTIGRSEIHSHLKILTKKINELFAELLD